MDLNHLDTDFSVQEVWNAIKEMPMDKCPGPDGFTNRFFLSLWAIVKDDVMADFNSLSRLDARGFGAVNQAGPRHPIAQEAWCGGGLGLPANQPHPQLR